MSVEAAVFGLGSGLVMLAIIVGAVQRQVVAVRDAAAADLKYVRDVLTDRIEAANRRGYKTREEFDALVNYMDLRKIQVDAVRTPAHVAFEHKDA